MPSRFDALFHDKNARGQAQDMPVAAENGALGAVPDAAGRAGEGEWHTPAPEAAPTAPQSAVVHAEITPAAQSAFDSLPRKATHDVPEVNTSVRLKITVLRDIKRMMDDLNTTKQAIMATAIERFVREWSDRNGG